MKNNKMDSYNSSLQSKNTARCNLSASKLTIACCEFGKKQIREIAFQFAHDIMDCFENGGDLASLSAKSVYSLFSDIFKSNN